MDQEPVNPLSGHIADRLKGGFSVLRGVGALGQRRRVSAVDKRDKSGRGSGGRMRGVASIPIWVVHRVYWWCISSVFALSVNSLVGWLFRIASPSAKSSASHSGKLMGNQIRQDCIFEWLTGALEE